MTDIHHEAEVLRLFSAPIDIFERSCTVEECSGNATHKLDGDRLRVEKIGS